jgi:flagellar protein FlaG
MKVGDVVSDLDAKAQRAAADKRTATIDAARQAVAARQETPPPPAPHKIESVTRQIDSFLRSQNHQLQFRVDQGSGKMVVTVTDGETGEVIRQVPGEEALKMAQRIEDMTGLLDEEA